MNYTEEEVCVILEGRVRLSDVEGNAKEFDTGTQVLKESGKP